MKCKYNVVIKSGRTDLGELRVRIQKLSCKTLYSKMNFMKKWTANKIVHWCRERSGGIHVKYKQ